MNTLNGLTLPLSIKEGEIVDAKGKPVLMANRNSLETPLNPSGRDAILQLTCKLLNDAFQYDHADRILQALGY